MSTKNGKRILSVKIKTMADDNPDTSHLGEYSQRPANEFAIDRAHTPECASIDPAKQAAKEQLERIASFLENEVYECDCSDRSWYGQWHDTACPLGIWRSDDALETVQGLAEEMTDCDCGERKRRNELRYFNPSFNYVKKDGSPADGLTPEDVRKYTRQDYERMESLNAGHWAYVGVRAECEIQLGLHSTIQVIRSGGLWGIESDSDADYLRSVRGDELNDLKSELIVLGFSKRAISTAFKNVQEVN